MFLKILNLRRFSAIWLLIATIAVGIIPQNQSYAQAPAGCPTDSTWSHTLNFRTANQSQWLLINSMDGKWESGVGWKAINYPNSGGGGNYDEMRGSVVFSNWSNELDTVLYTYSYVRGDGSFYSDPRAFVGGIPIGGTATAQGNNLLYLVNYGFSSNMRFRARPDTYNIVPSAKFEIHEAFICGHGDNPFDNPPAPIEGFDRPLLATDNHPLQYWSNSWDDGSVPQAWCDQMVFPLIVPNCEPAMNGDLLPEGNDKRGRISYDALPNLYTFPSVGEGDVYSIGEGTVVTLAPLTTSNCATYLLGPNATECAFEVPPYASGDPYAEFYRLNASDLYLLQVLTGDDYLITYILAEPTVEVGDSVGINCILGRIPQATIRPFNLLSTYSLSPQIVSPNSLAIRTVSYDLVSGAVFVGVDDLSETPDLPGGYPMLLDHNMAMVSWGGYPDPGLSCKLDPAFSGCVSVNPKFENDGEYWQNVSVVNPVEWRNPGVIIPPGGGVRLPDLVLDNVPYGLSFTARTWGGTSILSVKLGTDEWTETVSYTSNNFDRTAALITPDDGLFTTIEFRNTGQNDIVLDYACLHTGSVRQDVSSCLLQNYSFAMGGMSWTNTVGTATFITNTSQGNADSWYRVAMPRDSVIAQHISIYPNEDGSPHTYQLQVYGRRLSAGSGVNIQLNGVTIMNQTFNVAGFTTLTANFTVSTALENVTFRVQSIGDTSDDSIEIAKICIPGPHPGFGGGGPEPSDGCQVIPTPATTTVSSWIQWQWHSLQQYYNCTLMPVLSSWYGDFRQMVRDFTDIGFFFMQTAHRAVNWLGSQFLPWLAGYLSNISPGTILINQDNGQCAPWDVICWIGTIFEPFADTLARLGETVLNLLAALVILILEMLGALLGLVFSLVDQFVMLIGIVFQYIVGIGDAYVNATPEPIDGLPACLSPGENFICTGYWILENTILGGTGAYYVPLITGLGYILLFISLFKRARNLVISSADRI